MLTTNPYSRGDHRDYLIQKFKSENTYKGSCYGKCVECTYDPDADGTWRKQIEDCTCSHCPNYDMRPTSVTKH